jgi:hypothetical protein
VFDELGFSFYAVSGHFETVQTILDDFFFSDSFNSYRASPSTIAHTLTVAKKSSCLKQGLPPAQQA